MSKIAEIISNDGEVIGLSDFNSAKQFEFKILNSLDFEIIKEFFIKKTIIDLVKQKNEISNGSNGVTKIDLIKLFKLEDVEMYLYELEQRKIIEKRDGVNLGMYFFCKK